MSAHPYRGLPEHCFFRSVRESAYESLAWLPSPKFRIRASDRIVTAGSCFARNLAVRLPSIGLNHHIAERAPWFFTPEEAAAEGYADYSCRYGNVYTVRQLRELLEQAFALRPPVFDLVREAEAWFDLLRPRISASGFESERHAVRDREYHLARVKAALSEADVFVFTPGLTEAWVNSAHGYTYPSCPGAARGVWNPALHVFRNFRYAEVLADLDWVCGFLVEVNPAIRILLTVSPVALVATRCAAEQVIAASAYSKSVLRAAVGEIAGARARVQYFPSYEIVASPQSQGRFLAPDLRDASASGVAAVMEIFRRTLIEPGEGGPTPAEGPPAADAGSRANELLEQQIAEAAERECEELFNDTRRVGA
jgi:hypothetical protein